MAEGAAYGVAALTAWVALVRRGALQRGETLLVHGASGGTGLAAVQLGRYLGATVIATGSSHAKLEAAREPGAQHLLVVAAGARGLSDAVKALTDGPVPTWSSTRWAATCSTPRCTAPPGAAGCWWWALPAGASARVPSNLPLIKGFSVVGVRAGEYGRRDPERGAQNRQAVEALAAQGLFSPAHRRDALPSSSLPEAYRAMAERRVAGKIVIEM